MAWAHLLVEIGKSLVVLSHTSCNTKPQVPKPRVHATCLPHVLGTHLATSSSGFRGSRIQNTNGSRYWKPRSPELRYLDVHGFVLVGSPPAIGVREIANSLVVNPLHREFPSAEPRNPEVLYHVSRRSINGPDWIGKSLFAISNGKERLPPQTPKPDFAMSPWLAGVKGLTPSHLSRDLTAIGWSARDLRLTGILPKSNYSDSSFLSKFGNGSLFSTAAIS